METLKYKVITSEKQYDKYCETLHGLVFSKSKNTQVKEEIALLTLLIEKWDEQHNIFDELDPVELLRSLMKDHKLRSVDLAKQLKVSPGRSQILSTIKKVSPKTSSAALPSFLNYRKKPLTGHTN